MKTFILLFMSLIFNTSLFASDARVIVDETYFCLRDPIPICHTHDGTMTFGIQDHFLVVVFNSPQFPLEGELRLHFTSADGEAQNVPASVDLSDVFWIPLNKVSFNPTLTHFVVNGSGYPATGVSVTIQDIYSMLETLKRLEEF